MEMLINIIFICAFLLFAIGMGLIKISENEQSICKSLIVSIWTAISIGAILAFLMSCLHIPIMLFSMTVVYSIGAVIIWIYLLLDKDKRVQRFIFVWSDFLYIIFCSIVLGSIFIKVFGLELSISYNGVDAGTHFSRALYVLNTHKLNRMYFTSLYNSLFIEIFQPFLLDETLYKAFILSDAFFNLLNILMFYVVASEFVKSKFTKIVLSLIIVFYFLGWPVWSWIAGGFVYYGVGITICMYGVYLLCKLDESHSQSIKRYYGVLLLVTLICITECYLLFTPIFMATILIYMLYSMRNHITKEVLIKGFAVTVMICLVVFTLIFWGFFGGNISSIFRAFRINGGVHRELYKDFMFLLPINTFMCVMKFKKRKIDPLAFFIMIQFIVTVLALVANVCGVISDYYYFKLYYLGWALQMIGVVQAVDFFWNQARQVIYYCLLPVVMVAVLEITGLSAMIIDSITGNSEMFPVITQSMGYIRYLHDSKKERKEYMVTAYKWINDNLGEYHIPLITTYDDVQITWYAAITGGKSYGIDKKGESTEERLNNMLLFLKESESQYFTIMKDIDMFSENVEWFDQFEKVYDDGYYGVYMIDAGK
ncbi:MAG: hypothetical protein HFJ08_03495 [Lachnospiraceae bacterium]|nr:hypothetical protein [Lachnospiraceae bacterium]